MTKRIGVFSGTFDPFHVAHLEACLVAKAACELDNVVILTEKKPHRKSGVTSYQKRLAMIDLALQEYPSIRMLEAPGDNITIDNTLPILESQFSGAEYWYIIGSDTVAHLSHWKNVEALFQNLQLCVILRDNNDKKDIEEQLKGLKKDYPDLNYRILPEVWSPISSSKIRAEIAKRGYSQYVHRNVIKYILKHDVY